MKFNIHLILLAILNILFVGVISAQKMPKDFELTFKFGYHAEEATFFDSKKRTLVVQGLDTVMTFKLKLTNKEKQTIYNELEKINFISYPEKYKYTDSLNAFLSLPCRHFFLKIILNNNFNEVEWDNCVHSTNKDEKHAALMTLDRVIEKIIWARNPLKDYHPARVRFDPN